MRKSSDWFIFLRERPLKKALGQASNFAEQNGLIEVENNKADGSKRKKDISRW